MQRRGITLARHPLDAVEPHSGHRARPPAQPPVGPATTSPVHPSASAHACVDDRRAARPAGPRAGLLACAVATALGLAAAPTRAADEATPPPASAAADRPLARFVTSTPAGDELQPLLTRVLEAGRATDPLDPEDDERLLRRLRNSAIDVLATEGYFSPTITVELDDAQRSRYALKLDPGPRTRVRSVDITLTGAIERQPERIRELVEAWELDVGTAFRDPLWTTAKAKLLARVQERDFPAARLVESGADIDVDESAARLRVAIDSGPAFTLGELDIVEEPGKGLQRYDRGLVERFNDIRPGDRYDATRLLELQRRLQSGPYFSGVLVDVPIDPARHERVPIRLTLVEARSKRISAGVGFSTNFGPRVEGMYRQVGLFGLPYTLQTGLGIDRTRTIGFADILLPPKPNGALDTLGVLGERTDIQNLFTQRWGVGVSRVLTEDLPDDPRSYETRIALKLQREATLNRDGGIQPRGVLPEKFVNDTLSLSYTWTRRNVDSLTNPTRGNVLTLVGAGGVSRTGLSDLLSQSFLHAYGRYVWYLPVFDRHQVILRGEVGHVVTDDIRFVPLEFRFRAGGSGSVRGYQYQSLGVKDGATVIGATSLAIGSAEYVHWLTPAWGAAAFYDVGDADNELMKIRWARGYGVGARWRTVAGPLALDVAYGERDREWRVHFAIAVAF